MHDIWNPWHDIIAFSSYASPVFFINKAFPGSNVYTAADMPEIDVLAISHGGM